MLRAATITLIFVAAACGGGSSSTSDDDRCQRMVDHLIDLRVEPLAPETADRHRAILEDTVAPRVLESCATAAPAYIDCVLAAKDQSAVGSCEAKGGRS